MSKYIDIHQKVTFSPQDRGKCSHLNSIATVTPDSDGCEECLAQGMDWVHLRICMTCGHVGCCDSSIGKHASKHAHHTNHPVSRSIEPGEKWGWCYIDKVYLK